MTEYVAPPSRLRLEFPRETASSEVRGEGREPLEDKAGELTLLSRSGGAKNTLKRNKSESWEAFKRLLQ